MTRVDPLIPTEAEEQAALFRWAKIESKRYPELEMLFHVPNEGLRSYRTGAAMKAAGLRKGVPDLWLPVARHHYHGLVIELKRTKGGRVSAEQQDWIDRLNAQGYKAVVCKGWEEAAHALSVYIAANDRR